MSEADFLPADGPAQVVQRVRAWVALGQDPPDAEQQPAAVGKLRLAGVYDDRQSGFFMLRTRIPGGKLTTAQADAIAEVAETHSVRPEGANGPERFVEVTTRQDLQLHWIRFEDLPAIWERYDAVGLTTLEACGDTLRNVTTCPVAGRLPDEVLDAGPVVAALTALGLTEFQLAAFLPRKFKVTATGCRSDCVIARINDLAFTPASSAGRIGFNVHAGGGLSDSPRLASQLDLFATPAQVPEVVRAALLLFKERGDPEHKAVNRFRVLVDQLGPEQVEAELRARLPFAPPQAGEDLSEWRTEDHLGVRPEREPGRSSVGLCVPVGRLSAAELAELARLARTHGDGELRLTQRQDVVLTGVAEQQLDALLEEPLLSRLRPDPDPFASAVVTCTSAPFCKFGLFDVKEKGLELIDYLRRTVPDSQRQALDGLRLHVSGCKASCGQTLIGDVGLRAAVAKDEHRQLEAFDVAAMGAPGAGRLGRWIASELPVEQAFVKVAELVGELAAARSSR